MSSANAAAPHRRRGWTSSSVISAPSRCRRFSVNDSQLLDCVQSLEATKGLSHSGTQTKNRKIKNCRSDTTREVFR
jgi:hypothetical protein